VAVAVGPVEARAGDQPHRATVEADRFARRTIVYGPALTMARDADFTMRE
jgi:hypothetical protein